MKTINPKDKLEIVVNEAWKIFKFQFLNERFSVTKEAPFQHYFGHILKNIGDLYCFSRNEIFLVDLETKEEKLLGKNKYIDITIGFYENGKAKVKGAIELKFKKKSQGADDFARIDSYVDIQSLEHCLEKDYDISYFCMIADYDIYIKKSREGTTGQIFSMRNNYTPPINVPITNPKCKGRHDTVVTLKSPHTFVWETIDTYQFLLLPIHK